MTYDDDLMLAFLAMARCDSARTESGELEVGVPDLARGERRWYSVGDALLDALLEKGWIRLVGEDEVEGTERGLYHLERWRQQKLAEARKARRGRSR